VVNCSSPLVLSTLADGNYTFAVKAVDKAGFASQAAMVNFAVDASEAGDFQILGVTGGNDVKVDAYLSENAAPKLSWSASKGAQTYNVSIYDATNTTLLCNGANINGANVEYQFANCVLSDGAMYVARASANRNGQEKKAPNFSFKADFSPPVISINPVVKDDEKKTASFMFSVSDVGSGVKSAICYRKYKTDVRIDDCTAKTSIAYTDLPQGDYEFYIVASDNLDHAVTSASQKWTMQYVVCDPFNAVEGKCVKGLKGNLYYASADDRALGNTALNKKFSTVDKLITDGLKSNAVIYLPFIDVRTRDFTEGFGTSDGGKLKDDAGKVLDEWFALDLESLVKLGDTDAEGYYQFVTVSDDGSNLFINDGTLRRVVNNDGIHSTKVACQAANDAILFTKASRFPIKVQYYQGPRTKIAMSILWRKVATKDAALSQYCGRTENTSDGLNALLTEGFKPLNATNFILAEEVK
jgi:hypothetical protein